ncbi:MAG: hypothetical protein HC848_10835 [Limnobacter sp.]|nr:hypothetical protein [Limnobacter sp.]
MADPHPEWLAGFSAGLLQAAQTYHCPLIGGDTTGARGATVVAIQVFGYKPAHLQTLQRNLAVPGPGGVRKWQAGAGPGWAWLHAFEARGRLAELLSPEQTLLWRALQAKLPHAFTEQARLCLFRPAPPLSLAGRLGHYASAGLDLSDGLAGDLAHLCTASRVGVLLQGQALLDALLEGFEPGFATSLSAEQQYFLLEQILKGGDDYELCFTLDAQHQARLAHDAHDCHSRVNCVGHVVGSANVGSSKPGAVQCEFRARLVPVPASFNHFSGAVTS